MSQRSVPAPFLTKTYQLVDDSSTDDVISWNENGDTFVVWKNAEFAKDLLPKYFKHNNFSSFVRQLNTYGFRKTVPDKWEFANDNFKRAHKDLLCKIRRRKAATLPPLPAATPAQKTATGVSPSPSNSTGDDPGSTSSKNSTASSVDDHRQTAAAASQLAVLADENKRLKRHNEMLSSELTETKKRCDEVVSFLTECLKVGPDQIDQIMRQGSCGSTRDATTIKCAAEGGSCEYGEGDSSRLKLFGIWLNDEGKNARKRVREEKAIGFAEHHANKNKALGVRA
ncbi:heat shock factor protein HSF24-like [Punica granatum]|uniref:HSF-type DNA-binding domain-containing protein n=2 Tax=Punica granatum TaxID=22663 RepID=A0A218W2A8_PUNGR|nr:heat shock factor protein HSF24-like [Punica granatum]OWM66252.1 hypothetical protein CDL15_Pgr013469 [Punica granatum]PKI50140.1 hypothetical protein CRG98_029464 [Punica granatum]